MQYLVSYRPVACMALLAICLTTVFNGSPAKAGRVDSTSSEATTSAHKAKKIPGSFIVAQRRRATGRNVVEVRYPGGVFKQTSGRNWVERNRDGKHRFTETQRDDWSVYLLDRSRGVRIQLDLHRREIFYSNGSAPRQVLYRITSASAKSRRHHAGRKRNDSCRRLRGRVSRRSDVPVRVTFVNQSGAYRSVLWVNFKGGVKQYAGLNPGQSFTINTFASHPWMFTDGPGNCIEMYMPRPGQRAFVLTAPNRNFGRE
ncbi:MAG: hypothetical protein ACRBBN_15935 [Methyloligellaceae bacterium]